MMCAPLERRAGCARTARRMRALLRGSYGKLVRGCKVTLLIKTLSEGLSVPCSVGACMITSALLMPSITRPKTVYFLSNAGCFFSVMNHWQFAVLILFVRAAPSVPRAYGMFVVC